MAEPYNNEELESFRRQWKNEIVTSQGQQVPGQLDAADKDTTNDDKAMAMYLTGVEHEESGELLEAIKYYKRAIHLSPDVEQRIYMKPYEAKEPKEPLKLESVINTLEDINLNVDADNEEEYVGMSLLCKFQKQLGCDGRICIPKDEPKGTHISALPWEIVVYLLKWVVSSDLDLKSLEQVSSVCKGLYICSRDAEIWKLVCQRTWNTDCGSPQDAHFPNWREMFILRPRLQFHGCYISKTTYVRAGENSFQDANSYQPWHLINYYRYVRFFSDRSAVMLTTADTPLTVLGHLKRHNTSRLPSLLHGYYTLQGNVVTAIFKRKAQPSQVPHYRRRRKEDVNNNENVIREHVFHLEMEIRSIKRRLHSALHWNRYSVQTIYQKSEPSTTHFDVVPSRFPTLWFSCVRSYNAESEHAL